MSISTHVVGFRPPDAKWRKMRAAWEACKAAGVDAPAEVERFFGGEDPDEAGVEVSLNTYSCIADYKTENRDGYEVDITKLPKDVTIIRFYNSY